MSLFINNKKIKSKCNQLINIAIPQKIGKDIDYISNILIPHSIQPTTQDILNENFVRKLDDILEQPKSSNLRKLIFSMLLIFTILGICFSFLEDSPRTLKFLRNGSYINSHIVL